jgi:hypothetical protein
VLYLNAERPTAARFARTLYGAEKIREVKLRSPLTHPDEPPSRALDEAYLYLRNGGEGEQTVVVDSIGELFRVLLEEATGGGKPTLPQYGDVTTKVERFCRSLCDLPLSTVLVAHEQAIKDEEIGIFERLPVTGTSNPMLGVKLMAMVDIVGYCGRLEATQEGQADVHMAQLVTANGRRGKDGSGVLGKTRPLDLTEWIQTAAATVAPIPQPQEAQAA